LLHDPGSKGDYIIQYELNVIFSGAIAIGILSHCVVM